jgi:hypothetical protein
MLDERLEQKGVHQGGFFNIFGDADATNCTNAED